MSDRSKSIGASEVACLFGCSPWQSEYSLWLLKTGLVEEQASTERMRAGLYLERAILDEWLSRECPLDEVGVPLKHNTHSFSHPTYPFITATPDAVAIIGGVGYVGDVKTVDNTRRRDWDDGVPEYYRIQLQTQMAVTGSARAVLIAQFGFSELSHEWIDADQALQDEIVKRCCEFWKRVQGELPPPDPDGSDATTEALKRRRVDAKAIELSPDVRTWTEELEAIERKGRIIGQNARSLKNKIRAALGDASTGVFGDGTGWRIQTITRKEAIVKASTYTKLSRIKAKDAETEWDGAEE